MAISAVLIAAAVPIVIRSVEIKAGEKTALEIVHLQDVARKFYVEHDKVWPQNLGELQQGGYVNPQWDIRNPWGNGYMISNAAGLFSIATDVPQRLTGLVTARVPMSSVSGNTVTSTIALYDNTGGGLDPGIIVAWSGTVDSIPAGWVLCDGANGTPDLRDKFIVGARQDDQGVAKTMVLGSLSQTGGSISHNHGGTTGSHVLTIAEIPPHSHGYYKPRIQGRYDGHSSQVVTDMDWVQGETVGGGQGHTHTIASGYNVPPYYALAFIMKLP